MFYSHCLLSRKGPYGAIWVAAYCIKRLTKRQINEIDIPTSVDKILTDDCDDWESVKYRILAYLLLGVVRIFSKKVEYMFDDCHGIINELNRFVANKRTVPFRNLVRLPDFTLTLPSRYELDAFTVEVPEDTDRMHVTDMDTITIRDKPAESSKRNQPDKNHQPEDDQDLQDKQQKADTSADIVASLTAHGSPERCIPPDRVEVGNTELDSPEDMRAIMFPREECLDFEAFVEQNEAECLEKCKSASNVVRSIDEQVDQFHEMPSENHNSVFQGDKEVTAEKNKDPRSSATSDQVTLQNQDVCFNIEGTPDTRAPDILKKSNKEGITEHLDVQTPAVKENSRKRRKSAVMYDNYIGLSNSTLKRWTKDSSDLLRKRKKSARATQDSSRISDNFSEPSIPWAITELRTPQKLKSTEFDVAEASDTPHETTMTRTDISKPQKPKSIEVDIAEMGEVPDTPPHEMDESLADMRSVIAPRTPALCPVSPTRLFGSPQPGDLDTDCPPIPFENATRDVDAEVALSDLMNEDMGQNEKDGHNEKDVQGSDGWSIRTRTTARWLHQLLTAQKKRKKEKTANVSVVLNGKSRKESARIFYEILVLKSGGYVDVKQDEPYSDILLHETPKMMANLEKCY